MTRLLLPATLAALVLSLGACSDPSEAYTPVDELPSAQDPAADRVDPAPRPPAGDMPDPVPPPMDPVPPVDEAVEPPPVDESMDDGGNPAT